MGRGGLRPAKRVFDRGSVTSNRSVARARRERLRDEGARSAGVAGPKRGPRERVNRDDVPSFRVGRQRDPVRFGEYSGHVRP